MKSLENLTEVGSTKPFHKITSTGKNMAGIYTVCWWKSDK